MYSCGIERLENLILGEKRTPAMSTIIHEFTSRGGISLERRQSHQGLSTRIIQNQVHGRHLGIFENRERRSAF